MATTYDEKKLTNLGHLKDLAEEIDIQLGELTEKLGRVEAASGEDNVIEIVKVNGTAQKVGADKSVDITVPTKVSQIENDEGYQKAAEVKSAVDKALNDFAEDVSDDGVVNTYKELVDYAAKHKGEAATFAGDIANNKKDITALKEKVGDTDVSEQIESALEGYAKTEDIPEEYVHPTSDAGAKAEGLWKVATDENGHIIKATAVVKGDITKLGIPESDTTYDPATQSDEGLMSAEDKRKLDGMTIASDEEVRAMLDEVFGD